MRPTADIPVYRNGSGNAPTRLILLVGSLVGVIGGALWFSFNAVRGTANDTVITHEKKSFDDAHPSAKVLYPTRIELMQTQHSIDQQLSEIRADIKEINHSVSRLARER